MERRIIQVIFLLLCLVMYCCIAFPYKEVLECNGSVCSVEEHFIIPPISAIKDYRFQQQAIIADYKRSDDIHNYTREVLSMLEPDELYERKWSIYELNLKERFSSFNRQGRIVSYKFNRDDTFCINTRPQGMDCRQWYMMMKKDRVLSTFYLYWTYDLYPGTKRRGIFMNPFITIDPALKILNMLESDKEHFKVTKYWLITKFDDN